MELKTILSQVLLSKTVFLIISCENLEVKQQMG